MRHLPSISSDFRPLPGLSPDRPHSVPEDKQEEKHGRGQCQPAVSASQYAIQSEGFFNQIAVNEREGREQWEHLQPSHQTVRIRLLVLYLLITGTI